MPQVSYKPDIIGPVRRLVVKVGSAVLSDAGGLRVDVIDNLAAQIDTIVHAGREIVLVTSGAIAAGRAQLGRLRGASIADRQAAAATGQIELMRQWAKSFGEHGRTVAQLLLTHQDLAERKRRNNAVHTMQALLAAGVVPIINENDTVAVEEIRMGDNDVLSSLVAGMIQAQLLVILSDVAGVLTGDPRKRTDARLIPLITDPEAGMRGLVAESAGPLGSGGMATKLKAARQAARAGISVIIAPGCEPDTIRAALDPAREVGTLI
ncbi:MAG: glutamate 5-kinase, partial [Candidatus Binataceae bacterium]